MRKRKIERKQIESEQVEEKADTSKSILADWEVSYYPELDGQSYESGKIKFNIELNSNGDVTLAEIIETKLSPELSENI